MNGSAVSDSVIFPVKSSEGRRSHFVKGPFCSHTFVAFLDLIYLALLSLNEEEQSFLPSLVWDIYIYIYSCLLCFSSFQNDKYPLGRTSHCAAKPFICLQKTHASFLLPCCCCCAVFRSVPLLLLVFTFLLVFFKVISKYWRQGVFRRPPPVVWLKIDFVLCVISFLCYVFYIMLFFFVAIILCFLLWHAQLKLSFEKCDTNKGHIFHFSYSRGPMGISWSHQNLVSSFQKWLYISRL